MPVVSMFFGIAIKVFYREHNPPHFHAYYQGFEGLFNINTGELMEGKFSLRASVTSELLLDSVHLPDSAILPGTISTGMMKRRGLRLRPNSGGLIGGTSGTVLLRARRLPQTRRLGSAGG